jgi:hypothetical protein
MAQVIKKIKSALQLLKELWSFMRIQKKWWLGPVAVILILMGLLIVVTEGSALAPFIYALF